MKRNKCEFCGNIGNDLELKNLPSGGKALEFQIAVNESWKDKGSGEKRERTDWIRLKAYNGTAENIAKHFKKGDEIFVDAAYVTEEVDNGNGSKSYYHHFRIIEFSFV